MQTERKINPTEIMKWMSQFMDTACSERHGRASIPVVNMKTVKKRVINGTRENIQVITDVSHRNKRKEVRWQVK